MSIQHNLAPGTVVKTNEATTFTVRETENSDGLRAYGIIPVTYNSPNGDVPFSTLIFASQITHVVSVPDPEPEFDVDAWNRDAVALAIKYGREVAFYYKKADAERASYYDVKPVGAVEDRFYGETNEGFRAFRWDRIDPSDCIDFA